MGISFVGLKILIIGYQAKSMIQKFPLNLWAIVCIGCQLILSFG